MSRAAVVAIVAVVLLVVGPILLGAVSASVDDAQDADSTTETRDEWEEGTFERTQVEGDTLILEKSEVT